MVNAGRLWKIVKITDANDESINKFVERNRIGKMVSNLYAIEPIMPLFLQYVGGEKNGGVIQHSRIVKVCINHSLDSYDVKVYTANTMIQLTLVEFEGEWSYQ